jgi:hypothetical protein
MIYHIVYYQTVIFTTLTLSRWNSNHSWVDFLVRYVGHDLSPHEWLPEQLKQRGGLGYGASPYPVSQHTTHARLDAYCCCVCLKIWQQKQCIRLGLYSQMATIMYSMCVCAGQCRYLKSQQDSLEMEWFTITILLVCHSVQRMCSENAARGVQQFMTFCLYGVGFE